MTGAARHFAIIRCCLGVPFQVRAEVVELADTPSDAISLTILLQTSDIAAFAFRLNYFHNCRFQRVEELTT
jgi:hypothetical protein